MAIPAYACSRCGSTEYEEVDGIWYCHNGHEQEGGQQVGVDDADFGRIGKISRQKDVKERIKVPKAYRGAKGFQLFLKAWQYILWKQCYLLIHQHGLPAELWNLVRELWSLRLEKLVPRLEKSTDISISASLDVPTTSESDTDTAVEDDLKTFKTDRHAQDNPTLPDTVSLNYIGILLLRYPMRLSTIYGYIRREEMCYIRAIRHVPKEILDHLAPEYYAALDTTAIPTEHDLQLAVYKTATMYGTCFGMNIPQLNWRLMLAEHIKSLALPLEVFPAAKSLAEIVKYTFTYPDRHHQRRHATTYPESQLIALIIIATKLLFPFDSHELNRYPRSASEPAAMLLNWNAWLRVYEDQNELEVGDVLAPEKAITVTDKDILEMPQAQMDQYMDWFQQTYVKDIRGEQVHKEIMNMFPLQDITPQNRSDDNGQSQTLATTRLKATQSQLRSQRVVSDDNAAPDATGIFRPGQRYQQYRSLDEMSRAAAHFHQEAAKLACISVDALLRACLRTERLLRLQQHEQRRAEYFGETEDPIERR